MGFLGFQRIDEREKSEMALGHALMGNLTTQAQRVLALIQLRAIQEDDKVEVTEWSAWGSKSLNIFK